MGTGDLESSARTRLESELREFNSNPPTHISFGPISEDNMFQWQGIIIGPMGGSLEGFIFQLSIQFPFDYPFNPPIVKFQTQVFHPNIGGDGKVDINILQDQWSPALTTENLLLSISSILLDPIVEFNQNPISDLYQYDKNFYKKKPRGWKKLFTRCL